MIKFVKGDIFTSDAQALVNPVNCDGVMGAGLARSFAVRYPAMLRDYVRACKDGLLEVGAVHTWHDPDAKDGVREWVVNVPTMRRPGSVARHQDVRDGLNALMQWVWDYQITSVALPALGCGIGRLPWADFKALAEEFSHCLPDADVTAYEPHERGKDQGED